MSNRLAEAQHALRTALREHLDDKITAGQLASEVYSTALAASLVLEDATTVDHMRRVCDVLGPLSPDAIDQAVPPVRVAALAHLVLVHVARARSRSFITLRPSPGGPVAPVV